VSETCLEDVQQLSGGEVEEQQVGPLTGHHLLHPTTHTTRHLAHRKTRERHGWESTEGLACMREDKGAFYVAHVSSVSFTLG
jgi:hypothetical protein